MAIDGRTVSINNYGYEHGATNNKVTIDTYEVTTNNYGWKKSLMITRSWEFTFLSAWGFLWVIYYNCSKVGLFFIHR